MSHALLSLRIASIAAGLLIASTAFPQLQGDAYDGGTQADPSTLSGDAAMPAGRTPPVDEDMGEGCTPGTAERASAASSGTRMQRGSRQAEAKAPDSSGVRTPRSEARQQAQFRREMSQCTSQTDLFARAECARRVWTSRGAMAEPAEAGPPVNHDFCP